MSKHKHNPRGRHHRNIVGGILAAALALTIVVAAQLGGADNSQFAANIMCPDGTSVPDGTTCPGGGTGGTTSGSTSCGAGYWWNGTSCQVSDSGSGGYTGGTVTDTQMQADCVAVGGTWSASTHFCQMPGGTGSTTGGTIGCASAGGKTVTAAECANYDAQKNACNILGNGSYWDYTSLTCKQGVTTSTCPSGQYWDFGTNSCKLSQTTTCGSGQYWDSGTNTCKSSTSTTNYAVDTVGACTTRYGMDGKVGVWNAATSTCSVPMHQSSGGSYPAGTCANGTAYPAGTGFPPCGPMTGTEYGAPGTGMGYPAGNCNGVAYPASTTGYPPCVPTTTTTPAGTEAWKQTTSTSCASAGYFWGTKTNYCYSTQLEKSNAESYTQPTYPVETVDGCKNKGGTWNASSSTCTWPAYNTMNGMTNVQPYDNTNDKYGFYNMLPMYPTFGPGMNGSFQGQMTFGHGMQDGFFNDGNFAPPTWDAQGMKDQYSQYGFDQDHFEFDKYQVDFNAEYQGPQIQNKKQELKRVRGDGKRQLREITQFEKDLERVKGRSGGNEACPAIANASAALSTAKAVVELMTNATEDTLEQAMTAQGQLFGNWETQGKWNDVMQAVQSAHQCEYLSQMQKDGGREVKQMTKELKRVGDAETKAYLQEILDNFSNVVSNLGDYYQPCDGGYGPCDPMEEARFAMDDLRMKFWDTMREQNDQFQYDDVCGNFDMIREHLSEATDIPEEMLAKASAMLNKGVAYCEDGNIDGAVKVLRDMERMKNQFEGSFEGGEVEFGRSAEDYMRDAAEFEFSDGEIDIDALMARIEERFLSKLETAVQAAVDRVTQAFTLKIAQMESEFASRLAEFQAAALDNVNIGFEGKLKDTIIESKTAVTEAVADLDNVLVAFEEEDIEIPADVQKEITEIYEFATVRNMTDEAAQEFKAEIDAATNEVIIAFQEDPEAAVEVLAEVIPELRDIGEKIYEGDKDAQLEGGLLPFGDLFGMEDDWTFGWAAAAKNEGFVNGQVVGGERIMNASADTNWAEALTMTARMVAGGEDKVPNEVDLADPIVREMPDWAQASVTYLLHEDRIDAQDLQRIYSNSNPGDSISRIEFAEVLHDVADLPAGDTALVAEFPDTVGLDAESRAAAASLIEAGVMRGEGSGDFNPDGTANRAAFAKMIIGAQDAAIAAGTIEDFSLEGDFGGDFGGAGFPDPTGNYNVLNDEPTI